MWQGPSLRRRSRLLHNCYTTVTCLFTTCGKAQPSSGGPGAAARVAWSTVHSPVHRTGFEERRGACAPVPRRARVDGTSRERTFVAAADAAAVRSLVTSCASVMDRSCAGWRCDEKRYDGWHYVGWRCDGWRYVGWRCERSYGGKALHHTQHYIALHYEVKCVTLPYVNLLHDNREERCSSCYSYYYTRTWRLNVPRV